MDVVELQRQRILALEKLQLDQGKLIATQIDTINQLSFVLGWFTDQHFKDVSELRGYQAWISQYLESDES